MRIVKIGGHYFNLDMPSALEIPTRTITLEAEDAARVRAALAKLAADWQPTTKTRPTPPDVPESTK